MLNPSKYQNVYYKAQEEWVKKIQYPISVQYCKGRYIIYCLVVTTCISLSNPHIFQIA